MVSRLETIDDWTKVMTTEKPTQADKDEAAKQLTEWLLSKCDIESVPQLVTWLELAKPKTVTDRLMAALTNHRRKKMLENSPKA